MACTTSSTCSAKERLGSRLGMAALHLRSQALERAQLQLLDGPFAFAEPAGDFPDASLVHEAFVNDAALRFRKLSHEPEQLRTIFNGAHVGVSARTVRLVC